jgi:ribosomal protein L31E
MAERLITLNIRKYLVKQPRTKRARKAIRYIRERIAHYTKIDVENVKIGYDVNNMVFKHYAKYMTPIKLKVNIGTDTADVLMYKEASEESSKNESKDKKKEKKDKVANTKQQEKTKSENIAKENNTNKKEDKKKA